MLLTYSMDTQISFQSIVRNNKTAIEKRYRIIISLFILKLLIIESQLQGYSSLSPLVSLSRV